MSVKTESEKFGAFYKEEIEKWIKLGKFDKKQYKKNYKLNVIKNDMDENRYYREVFRAHVLDDFYKFTHSISDVIERNPKYDEYIQKIDKENTEINRLDRQILANYDKVLVKKRDKLLKSRPKYTLIEIPRGLLKSTIFQTHRGAWYYLIGAVLQNQAPVIFVLHEDTNKADDNLNLIKQVLELDFIKFAFADVLEKNRDRVSEMSFTTKSEVMRKESHFMAQSIYKDFGGKHGSIFLVDDLELRQNTQTQLQVKKLMDAFLSWDFLDDNLGRMRFEFAGTARRENDVYMYIENDLDSIVWREGATTVDGTPTLHNEKITYNFPEVYDAAKVKQSWQVLKKNPSLYYSQIEMVPQPYEDDINIVGDSDYIYNDIDIATLMKEACIVTSKDPSYSILNKGRNDGGSRDVTITGAYYKECFYVFYAEQLKGGDNNTIFEPLYNQVNQFKSDVIIQDAQGTQKNYAVLFNDMLVKRGIGHNFYYKYYTKAKQASSVGKAQRAALVLGEMFRMNRIKIHSSLTKMIGELERHTKGYDYLDTLIMMVSLDTYVLTDIASEKQYVVKDIVRNNEPWNTNSTTGY